jgi:hypothetical protein
MNINAKETLSFHKEKENKKKDRFIKFHPSSKQLILFASAPNAFGMPSEPEESCKQFINAITHGVAKQELSMQLKSLNLSDMVFTMGLTLNLYSGTFLYAVCNSPCNFSCFSIYKGDHLDEQNQQDCQLILHLIETKGKGQSIKEIRGLNKQKIKCPTTYIDMMQQFEGFHGLISIFFGQYSIAHQAITSIICQVKKFQQSFKAQICVDKEFRSQFMYAINTCFQLWLDGCMTAVQCNCIDDSILDCCLLIESIPFRTFALIPSSSFTEPPAHSKDNMGKKGARRTSKNNSKWIKEGG